MRRGKKNTTSAYKILVVDDEIGVIDSLSVVLRRSGYMISGTTNPIEAIQLLRNEHFDMLILDYLMTPIHGDRVVELVREFDRDLYILLLTGYKDLAPPLQTIRLLDIQGYCEKTDQFDQLMLMVESGIKSISQMHTIKNFKDGLSKILRSVPNIYHLQPIDKILETILEEAAPIVGSNNTCIQVDDLSADGEHIFRGAGHYKSKSNDFAEKISPELRAQIGTARTSGHSAVSGDSLVIPLISGDHSAFGALCANTENIAENKELIEIFSHQAAASLYNAFLHSMINKKNVELSSTYKLLEKHYLELVGVLRVLVDAKDVYTRGHSDRVSYFATKIGEKLCLRGSELEVLRIGSLFHDIGKISTPDIILLKKEALTIDEFEEIKKHPLKGADMLSQVSMFSDMIPLIKYHHEWLNGQGYPDGLKGEEIPLLAKIVSVADAFDAMMSDRSYRTRLSMQESIKRLTLGMGTQFDPRIVRTLIELTSDYDQMIAEIEKRIALDSSRPAV